MVELPIWFILTFDWGFAALELASVVAAIWSWLDTRRDLRHLRQPDAMQQLTPDGWKLIRTQRRGELAMDSISIFVLVLFAFIGVISGAAAQVELSRAHEAAGATSMGNLGLSVVFVAACVGVGAMSVIRVATRRRVRAVIEGMGSAAPQNEGRPAQR